MSDNKQIKESIKVIIAQLSNCKTKQNGLRSYKNLIADNITSKDKLTFIIHSISEYITKSSTKASKDIAIVILLPEFFKKFPSIKAAYPFVSRILTTIQSNMAVIDIDVISTAFDSIVKLIFTSTSSIEDKDDRHNFELFQGFCLYNMNQKEEECQIYGAVCLSVLIANSAQFLNKKFLKYIWEKLIGFIESQGFECKFVLLKCLRVLIANVKEAFNRYAIGTLYKVLDFLTESNVDIRREALDVIYLLVFHYKNDIEPLKKHIIEFLKALSRDNDDDIKNKCLVILKEYEIWDKSLVEPIHSKSLSQSNRQRSKGKAMRKQNIFSTCRNKEFFERAKTQNEILVVDYLNNNNMSNRDRHRELEHQRNRDESQSIIPVSISINQSKNECHSKSVNENDLKNMFNCHYNRSKEDYEHGNRNDNHDHGHDHEHEHENYVIYTYPNKNDNVIEQEIHSSSLSHHYLNLISQMKTLSHNQICLLDTVTLIKSEFHASIAKLNSRVQELELLYEKNMATSAINDQQSQSNSQSLKIKDALTSKDNSKLITMVNALSLSELKAVDHSIIVKVLNRVITSTEDFWESTQYSTEAKLGLIKKLLIGPGLQIDSNTTEALQNKLNHMLKIHKDTLTHDEVINVKLIQTYLNYTFFQ